MQNGKILSRSARFEPKLVYNSSTIARLESESYAFILITSNAQSNLLWIYAEISNNDPMQIPARNLYITATSSRNTCRYSRNYHIFYVISWGPKLCVFTSCRCANDLPHCVHCSWCCNWSCLYSLQTRVGINRLCNFSCWSHISIYTHSIKHDNRMDNTPHVGMTNICGFITCIRHMPVLVISCNLLIIYYNYITISYMSFSHQYVDTLSSFYRNHSLVPTQFHEFRLSAYYSSVEWQS